MNKIAMLGLIPFGILGPLYRSPTMFMIFVLGCLFHKFPDSRALYIIDTAHNTSWFLWGTIQERQIRHLSAFALAFFPLNSIVFPNPPNNKRWENIRHIIFVQWVGVYAFHVLYNSPNCNRYAFICDEE
jgi:hypothetical protein